MPSPLDDAMRLRVRRPGTSYAQDLADKYHDDDTSRQMREFQRRDSLVDRQKAINREQPPEKPGFGQALKNAFARFDKLKKVGEDE